MVQWNWVILSALLISVEMPPKIFGLLINLKFFYPVYFLYDLWNFRTLQKFSCTTTKSTIWMSNIHGGGTLAERKICKQEAPKWSVTSFSVNSHLITLQGPALTVLGYLFQLIACHIPLCSVFSSHSAFVFSPNVHAFFFSHYPTFAQAVPLPGVSSLLRILHFTDSSDPPASLHHHSLLNVFPPLHQILYFLNPMHLSQNNRLKFTCCSGNYLTHPSLSPKRSLGEWEPRLLCSCIVIPVLHTQSGS